MPNITPAEKPINLTIRKVSLDPNRKLEEVERKTGKGEVIRYQRYADKGFFHGIKRSISDFFKGITVARGVVCDRTAEELPPSILVRGKIYPVNTDRSKTSYANEAKINLADQRTDSSKTQPVPAKRERMISDLTSQFEICGLKDAGKNLETFLNYSDKVATKETTIWDFQPHEVVSLMAFSDSFARVAKNQGLHPADSKWIQDSLHAMEPLIGAIKKNPESLHSEARYENFAFSALRELNIPNPPDAGAPVSASGNSVANAKPKLSSENATSVRTAMNGLGSEAAPAAPPLPQSVTLTSTSVQSNRSSQSSTHAERQRPTPSVISSRSPSEKTVDAAKARLRTQKSTVNTTTTPVTSDLTANTDTPVSGEFKAPPPPAPPPLPSPLMPPLKSGTSPSNPAPAQPPLPPSLATMPSAPPTPSLAIKPAAPPPPPPAALPTSFAAKPPVAPPLPASSTPAAAPVPPAPPPPAPAMPAMPATGIQANERNVPSSNGFLDQIKEGRVLRKTEENNKTKPAPPPENTNDLGSILAKAMKNRRPGIDGDEGSASDSDEWESLAP